MKSKSLRLAETIISPAALHFWNAASEYNITGAPAKFKYCLGVFCFESALNLFPSPAAVTITKVFFIIKYPEPKKHGA
jgi:hypothetical protein